MGKEKDEEFLKNKLYEFMCCYGNTDIRTINVSRKLDLIVNKQQREITYGN